MKKDEDISLSLSRSDERLGSVLSRGLLQSDPGQCLEPESIAAVVEGTVTGEERDCILKHVTACDTCYEMFLLTSELHEEEASKKETYKILRLKPLALAASILIVIFSVYIFYNIEKLPKTPRELMEKSEAVKDPRTLPKQPKFKNIEFQTTGKTAPKDKKMKKIAEKKATTPPMEYRKKGPKIEAIKKLAPAPKKTIVQIPEKMKIEADATEEFRLGKEKKEGVKSKKMSKRDLSKVQRTKATDAEKIERKRNERINKMKMAEKIAEGKQTAAALPSQYNVDGVAPIQNQAVLLNVVGQRFEKYIPQKDLGNLFKETIVLSQQIGKEFKTIQSKAFKTGNLNEIDLYVKGLKPMITVKIVDNTTYISPNVEWFFSKSTPKSIEFQFFSLARSGWCDNSGLCYKGIKAVHRQLKRKAGLKGKVTESEDTVRDLLVKWQALHPQLSGIFKEISTNTISHLKVSK